MEKHIETRCIHGNQDYTFTDGPKAVSFPIYQTATFGHYSLGHSTGFNYTRSENPTRQHLEETISALEGACDTAAFSSGMAAVTACFDLLPQGSHILCSEDLYGGVTRLLNTVCQRNGMTADFIDTTSPDAIRTAIRPNTRALYIETPSNPMMIVTDLRVCKAIAREYDLLLIVDNTFLSPYFQNPLALGADLVIHSGSKFLSGHNDTIAGFLSTNRPDLGQQIREISKTTGANLAPFDCFLVQRGLKTLAVRMERQQENAEKLARWLSVQPHIRRVYYAGLPEHPGYAVNASQARGAGSMISFHTDTVETAQRILNKVQLIIFAESLGGTESLITYPMVQTHPEVAPEMREHLGITETLLRLSVGLENIEDLIADLAQAMEE